MTESELELEQVIVSIINRLEKVEQRLAEVEQAYSDLLQGMATALSDD